MLKLRGTLLATPCSATIPAATRRSRLVWCWVAPRLLKAPRLRSCSAHPPPLVSPHVAKNPHPPRGSRPPAPQRGSLPPNTYALVPISPLNLPLGHASGVIAPLHPFTPPLRLSECSLQSSPPPERHLVLLPLSVSKRGEERMPVSARLKLGFVPGLASLQRKIPPPSPAPPPPPRVGVGGKPAVGSQTLRVRLI